MAEVDGSGSIHGLSAGDATIGVLVTTPDGRLVHTAITISVIDPTRQTVRPPDDAFVRGGTYGDDNYGGSTSMTLKDDANIDSYREAYVASDFSDIDGEIESALSFTGRVQESGGVVIGDDIHTVEVYTLTDAWDEETVTRNTRPEAGELVTSLRIDKQLELRSIDLTDLVRAEAAGDGRLSVALRHDAAAGNRLPVVIRSKESTSPPYLDIRFATPWGPSRWHGLDPTPAQRSGARSHGHFPKRRGFRRRRG